MYSRFSKGILLAVMVIVWGCSKEGGNEQTGPDTTLVAPTPYTFVKPLGFPPPIMASFNPMTVEGVALGKALYSDPIVSSNGMSCASCHAKKNSYCSPINYLAPNGFSINVLPHINLAFKSECNWDGSVTVMDSLCMADFDPPIFNTQESELCSKLKAHPTYPSMFRKAFGIRDLDTLSFHDLKLTICFAITQYMRSLVSASSRYDAYRVFHKALTHSELNGMLIFFSEKGDCFHCHSDPLFTDNDYHNTGLAATYTGFDKGRMLVTGKATDEGKFRTPTLRNATYTAPYMHDGRFKTLEEVIEFYATGVQLTPNLDPIMTKRMNNRTTNLTQEEKTDLLNFLKTLSDTAYVQN